jgi:hypothetical protein
MSGVHDREVYFWVFKQTRPPSANALHPENQLCSVSRFDAHLIAVERRQLWHHVKLLKDQRKGIEERHNMLRIDIYPTKFYTKKWISTLRC